MEVNVISSILDNRIFKGSLEVFDCPKDKAKLYNFAYYNSNVRDHESNPPFFNSVIVLDFDSGIRHERVLELLPYRSICYASKSCTLEKDKFRLILFTDCTERLNEQQYAKMLEQNLPKEILDAMDVTCKQLSRFYFMPNKGDVFYIERQEKEPMHIETGFINLSLVPGFKKETPKKRIVQSTQGKCGNYDVITHYLNTPFLKMTGNGDSMRSLFSAVRCCVKYHDDLTLEQVLMKARSENWSEKELERILRNVGKYI